MTHSAEFLQRVEPEQGQARQRRTRLVRTLFVFFFVVLVMWLAAFVVSSVHATTQVLQAQADIAQAKASLTSFSFEQVRAHTQEAHASLTSARSVLPVIRSVSWVPVVGEAVDTFADVIASSEALLAAFDPVVDLGLDLMRLSGITQEYLEQVDAGTSPQVTFDDLPTETKRAVLQRLAASAQDLDLLVARLAILEEEISLLSQSTQVGPLLSLLDPLLRDLRSAQQPLELLSIAARLLPSFGGLEGPSSILLLFLNNNELRPGGGFIGSYGVLEMSGGDIAHLQTADVYALDRAAQDQVTLPPPEPLRRYNATEQWFFRDSNWSPDFAASSHQAIERFLEESRVLPKDSTVPVAQRIDHIIGFTPTYASDLLAITGPITVGGQTFTSENVADLLEYQVQYGYADNGVPEAQRKEILADLVNEMKTRLYSLPSQEWPAVFEASQKALREKQMLLFSTHEQVQDILTRVGWDGSMDSLTLDTLLVVDANLASLKSDPAVERDVTYRISQDPEGQWVGRVSIHYKHNGTFDWKTTRYRTYTRVYLPFGTQFLGVEGSWLNDKTQNPTRATAPVEVVQELGLTSFGTFTSVEPGDEHTLSFDFLLAPEVVQGIRSGTYALTVLKQAGAQNNALTLDLDFDKNVTHASPSEDSGEWGDDAYRLNTILSQDFRIDIELLGSRQ